jgi:hypothetical protein
MKVIVLRRFFILRRTPKYSGAFRARKTADRENRIDDTASIYKRRIARSVTAETHQLLKSNGKRVSIMAKRIIPFEAPMTLSPERG